MLQKGEIHADVAMHLLGGGIPPVVGSGDDGDKSRGASKKRPLESGGDDEQNPENPGQDIDDLLDEARRAKLET